MKHYVYLTVRVENADFDAAFAERVRVSEKLCGTLTNVKDVGGGTQFEPLSIDLDFEAETWRDAVMAVQFADSNFGVGYEITRVTISTEDSSGEVVFESDMELGGNGVER